MVFFRTIAGTYLVIGASVGVRQRHIANVASAYLTVAERFVARMLRLVLLVFACIFGAAAFAPVTIGLVSPDSVHGIAFEERYCSCCNDVSTIVLNKLVLGVADVKGNLIAKFADAVIPFSLKFPSPGL